MIRRSKHLKHKINIDLKEEFISGRMITTINTVRGSINSMNRNGD